MTAMMRARTTTVRATVALLGAMVMLGGCKEKQPKPAPTTEIHSYTVRGEVTQLPVAGDDRTEFMVRHEAIPEFKGPQGERGMDTMTMPFPIRAEHPVSLDEVSKGDKVEVTFEVVFDLVKNSPVDWYTVKVEELPADTALDFSSIREP